MRTLKLDTHTFSQCITNATRYQRLAFQWANRETDFRYQQRFNMTPSDCAYQSQLAAGFSAEWYGRARKAH